MARTYTAVAHVISVWDGDTFHADLDLGWGIWNRGPTSKGQRVRIANIAAPELHEVGGPEAKAFLEELIAIKPVLDLVSYKAFDQYGRTLATCSSDGRDIGEMMVQAGHAKAWWKSLTKTEDEE